MERAFKSFQTDHATKASGKKAKRMETDVSSIPMDLSTKENSSRTRLKDLGSLPQKDQPTMVNGKMTSRMAWAKKYMKMDPTSKAPMSTA